VVAGQADGNVSLSEQIWEPEFSSPPQAREVSRNRAYCSKGRQCQECGNTISGTEFIVRVVSEVTLNKVQIVIFFLVAVGDSSLGMDYATLT
jgi:methionyl-tRNA synthetase